MKIYCFVCKKRIKNLLPIQCKCGNYYCNKHKIPQDHKCQYDYIIKNIKNIENQNPVIKGNKLEDF
jgi:predicted nucleic acid binding AN1-type Zn finger protein